MDTARITKLEEKAEENIRTDAQSDKRMENPGNLKENTRHGEMV